MARTRSFKAHAHILKLLGDQLIGNDRLAIFELVKNAYDANATEVRVELDLDSTPPVIEIKDNGLGMNINTIESKWLELGTDSKRGDNRTRTPKPLRRLPLGEKGIGRLAVHKLGGKLKLVTKSVKEGEYVFSIDWASLAKKKKLSQAKVTIKENTPPQLFKRGTGTCLKISGLHRSEWTRREVRSLAKLVNNLVSPFETVSDFKVELFVPGRESWIADLPDVKDILDRAIWKYDFEITDNAKFAWSYRFDPPSIFTSVSSQTDGAANAKLETLSRPSTIDNDDPDDEVENQVNTQEDRIFLISDDLQGIGPISGRFYFYYRRNEVLSASGDPNTIKGYLSDQSGVRVYRDGIRVFNYGEPGDDWLELNVKRINNPTEVFGTSSIIGGISLQLEHSLDPEGFEGLHEKTNREGFDENETYRRFKWIVNSVLEQFFIRHRNDREELDRFLGDIREISNPSPEETFAKAMNAVRETITKHGLEKKLSRRLNYIDVEYRKMREVTLNTGKGLNLSIIFHEVEREIISLNSLIKRREPIERLLQKSEHVVSLIEGFQPLLRRNKQSTFKASQLIINAITPLESRFKHHKIIVTIPDFEESDFEITAPYGLILASLQNLIENSMYWTRYRSERNENQIPRRIAVFAEPYLFLEGPAIIVADNGPGFNLPPEEAIRPFHSSRPGGAGLGLYFVNLVMENVNGRLLIMSHGDLELPQEFDGAAVVLLFKALKQ